MWREWGKNVTRHWYLDWHMNIELQGGIYRNRSILLALKLGIGYFQSHKQGLWRRETTERERVKFQMQPDKQIMALLWVLHSGGALSPFHMAFPSPSHLWDMIAFQISQQKPGSPLTVTGATGFWELSFSPQSEVHVLVSLSDTWF